MPRALSPAEHSLIAYILSAFPTGDDPVDLGGVEVTEMDDGGMGSLEFVGVPGRRMSGTIGIVEFADADGVPVNAALLTDRDGKLYQLDIWKVDFSALQRIPGPEDFRPAFRNADVL